jgi:RimJ/RimL family protein N-acetyltransferase
MTREPAEPLGERGRWSFQEVPMSEKTVVLKDGRRVMIREIRPDDTDRSFAFFSGLPEEDRRYLRVDVTRREVVEARARDVDAGRVVRLVAVEGEGIIADGSLEVAGHGWGENIAELRLIVARPYQRLGMGTLLARELFFIAAERKVDRVVARVMRPQEGARQILRQLGFKDEFVIPEHVRDRNGNWQDLIIMRCNLEDLWVEMEGLLEGSDLQWHR